MIQFQRSIARPRKDREDNEGHQATDKGQNMAKNK